MFTVSNILSFIVFSVIGLINYGGYGAITFLMALESACIPIPSEIIMPFSGFLVFQQQFNFWLVVLCGTLGNLIGSILAYWIGLYGGRPFIERYGKYFLFSYHDLDVADRWFNKYGQATVFFSRLLPVIRTFISLPAGIARMNFAKFSFYTLLGCLTWSIFLTYVGFKMGEHWMSIERYFHKFDYLIGGLIILFIILWIYRHTKNSKLITSN